MKKILAIINVLVLVALSVFLVPMNAFASASEDNNAEENSAYLALMDNLGEPYGIYNQISSGELSLAGAPILGKDETQFFFTDDPVIEIIAAKKAQYQGQGDFYDVVEVGESAFFGYADLETFVMPEGYKTIRNSAFENCPKLTTVILPASVTYISDTAFVNSTNVVIYAPAGSYAEKFAKDHEIQFKSVGDNAGFQVKINSGNFLTSLGVMGIGMFGIFVVIGVILLMIILMNKLFRPKQNKEAV